MAHVVKSKTPKQDKNRFATQWEAFEDACRLTKLNFILDAAAEPETTKCANFISPEEDALNTDWQDRFYDIKTRQLKWLRNGHVPNARAEGIWCNPPFDDKPEFIQKTYETVKSSGIPVVMMLPYERNTIWWQVMVHNVASKVFIPDCRYPYYLPDGKTLKTQINFASVFVLYEARPIHQTIYTDYSVMKLRRGELELPDRNLLIECKEVDSERRKFSLAQTKLRKEKATKQCQQ